MKSIFKSIISIILLILLCIVMLVVSAFAIDSCIDDPSATHIVSAIMALLNVLANIGLSIFVGWLCMKDCEDFDKRIEALEDKNERL